MTGTETGLWLHASCVVVGDQGVLIRGPSGSGKSTLAHRLIETAHARGLFAALVGDDRIRVEAHGGRLVASGHPAIAGQIELRGWAIASTKFEPEAVIRLLVDCETVLETRLPEAGQASESVLGVLLSRQSVTPDSTDRVLVALGYGIVTARL